ncbi:MAG: FAD-dependent oxidoreductase [Chloroflexota bacterium]
MELNNPFPNYMQMRQRIPIPLWHAARVLSVGIALGLIITLFIRPSLGLFLFWGVLIPFVPLLFFLAPGIWRNICPMAALNQTPRLFDFTRGLTAPKWFKEYGYVIAITLFVLIVSSRKVLFNSSGPATAILILLLLSIAFIMGNFFKGKSGWCSSICPLLPIQRIYGQTPFVTVPNSHCQPCVGCTQNCYDFNPRVAYLADLHERDSYFSGYRKFFVGFFPGFVLAYYLVPNPPEIPVYQVYGTMALYAMVSVGLFSLITSFIKTSQQQIAVIFGAVALNIYYWFNAPVIANLVMEPVAEWLPWLIRSLVLALTILWIYRTVLKENLFLQETEEAEQTTRVGGNDSLVSHQASLASKPEVIIDGKRIVVEGNRTLLDVAEANGLPIEAGCRMGVCGADPVCIVHGMENLSKISSDEKTTLERLALGENTRMACVTKVKGNVEVSLTPEQPKVFSTSIMQGFKYDQSVNKVVVIGNGIAGVTAADHVRRRHPTCEIHLIGRERHHLYNRMGITRLIYGRSAMQGLYLLPEKWYDDFQITTWLNTHVSEIDAQNQSIQLGTGEALTYDKLILTTGSQSFVPPIEGFGMDGSFVLREAEDAMAIRAFVQERICNHAVVAGGGLLGLEAAYGLHKLGMDVSVLERSTALLRRQLDKRGGEFLREYLEGLGISIVMEAETESVQGNNRIEQLTLKDGRTLPCDLLLVAAGIRSELSLAKETGLETNRGVIVDEGMRTSNSTIFAAGDVAEFDGKVLGLWPVAVAQAEVAAANAVAVDKDAEEHYTEIVPVTMLKVVGVDLTSIGRFQAADDEMEIVQEDLDNHRYRKLVIAKKPGHTQAVGAILIGYPEDAQSVAEAVKSQIDISSVLVEIELGNWQKLAELVE